VLIDNGSSDRTVEIAAAENCRIYPTHERYSASRFGVAWVNDILTRDFCGHWVLVLDADELFVYPKCEDVTIDVLAKRLEAFGYEGLPAVLVDMYPPSPISETQLNADTNFREVYRYYDCGNYVFAPALSCPLLSCWGGARSRVFKFGTNASLPHMALNKVPLVKWSAEISYLSSTHNVTPLRLPPFWAVLEHYKYMPDFAVRARQESIRREHWADASEYRAYAEVLEASPTFTFMNRLSRERTQSQEFVGTVTPFAWPAAWQ
jgi:glycosyltransferase involved in cell wall biosynthesis